MLTYFKHYHSYFSRGARAFTLVELIVVSAIIRMITTFILFQQNKFNSATLLRSLAYSTALSIRQAQVYGTSVRGITQGDSTVFGSGYGVSFSAGDLNHYFIFSDATPGNGQYISTEDTALPTFTIGRGTGADYKIKNICVLNSGVLNCSSDTSPAIDSLVVYFRRPNPDACFAAGPSNAGACAVGATQVYTAAYITLVSVGNQDTRSVKISTTGQRAVSAPNLPDITQC